MEDHLLALELAQGFSLKSFGNIIISNTTKHNKSLQKRKQSRSVAKLVNSRNNSLIQSAYFTSSKQKSFSKTQDIYAKPNFSKTFHASNSSRFI
jgi:hypothetical protein